MSCAKIYNFYDELNSRLITVYQHVMSSIYRREKSAIIILTSILVGNINIPIGSELKVSIKVTSC